MRQINLGLATLALVLSIAALGFAIYLQNTKRVYPRDFWVTDGSHLSDEDECIVRGPRDARRVGNTREIDCSKFTMPWSKK